MSTKLLLAAALAAGLLTLTLHAEEAGSGHYVPGATASFIDGLPGKPSLVTADAYTYYDGSAGSDRPLEFGGLLALNAYATGHADTVMGLYQTPLQLLGGFAGVGANGFYYGRVTGDSGSVAKLAHSQGCTVGVGPAISYVPEIGRADFAAEVKWLAELDSSKRLKGDYVGVKLGMLF